MNPAENNHDPNEAREVSILKRNLKLLKRVVLGKQAPPMFLKILCWTFIGWSLLMILGFVFIALSSSMLDAFEGTSIQADIFTTKYLFTYAILHGVSLLGVILMYRRRLTGWYIFTVANLLMPFWTYLINRKLIFDWTVFIFSLIAIALFALNWNQFLANIRKKERMKEQQ